MKATVCVQFSVGLAFFIESADLASFSALFKVLEEDLGLWPSFFGRVIFCEKSINAATIPIWGVLVHQFSTLRLLAVSALGWGCCTIGVAWSYSGIQLVASRFCLALFTGGMGPLGQVIVAESLPLEGRGKAFGCIMVASKLGDLIGGGIALAFQHRQGPLGLPGWRCILTALAASCLNFGVVLLWSSHLSYRFSQVQQQHKASRRGFSLFVVGFVSLLRNRSFWVVTVQGIFRSSSVQCLMYIGLWLQYLGFDDVTAAKLASSRILGWMIGGLFAGIASDKLAERFPDRGRISFAMLGDVLRVLLGVFVFKVLPNSRSGPEVSPLMQFMYGISLFLLGFFQPWAFVGCTRPILTEVVTADIRGAVMGYTQALDHILAGIISGPLIAWGFMLQGYQKTQLRTSSMPLDLRVGNAAALAETLFLIETICQVLMVLLLSRLFFTYVPERELAKQADGLQMANAVKPTLSATKIGYSKAVTAEP